MGKWLLELSEVMCKGTVGVGDMSVSRTEPGFRFGERQAFLCLLLLGWRFEPRDGLTGQG